MKEEGSFIECQMIQNVEMHATNTSKFIPVKCHRYCTYCVV